MKLLGHPPASLCYHLSSKDNTMGGDSRQPETWASPSFPGIISELERWALLSGNAER